MRAHQTIHRPLSHAGKNVRLATQLKSCRRRVQNNCLMLRGRTISNIFQPISPATARGWTYVYAASRCFAQQPSRAPYSTTPSRCASRAQPQHDNCLPGLTTRQIFLCAHKTCLSVAILINTSSQVSADLFGAPCGLHRFPLGANSASSAYSARLQCPLANFAR